MKKFNENKGSSVSEQKRWSKLHQTYLFGDEETRAFSRRENLSTLSFSRGERISV